MMHLGSSFGLIMVSLILAGILGVLSSSSGYQLKSIFSLSTSNTK